MDFKATLAAIQKNEDKNKAQKEKLKKEKEKLENNKKINKEISIERNKKLSEKAEIEKKRLEEIKEVSKKKEKDNQLKRQKALEEQRKLQEAEKERDKLLEENRRMSYRKTRSKVEEFEKNRKERIRLLEQKLKEKEEKKKNDKQKILKEIFIRNVTKKKEKENENENNIQSEKENVNNIKSEKENENNIKSEKENENKINETEINSNTDSAPVKEETVKQMIEDMVVYSQMVKEEIENKTEEEKKECYIPIEEAIKAPDNNEPTFIMGVLAKAMENNGAEVVIEKKNNNQTEEENQIFASSTLQFISSGLGDTKKFELHFDLGEERNLELLTDENEQKEFNDNLRKKLAEEYGISEDKIIITNAQRGSYAVNVIFMDSKFYSMTKEELKEKIESMEDINEEDESEFGSIVDVKEDILGGAWKISPQMFDSRGNRSSGFGEDEERGGRPYYPPIGWTRYGLNVLGKYDNDKGDHNNDWLAYDGRDGEWAVAYHGLCRESESDEIKVITGKILSSQLKPGSNQAKESYDDVNHPGQKVGKGVYCTPNPDTMEEYSGIINIGNEQYKIGLMLRVHPKKLREVEGQSDYWVVSGNEEDCRPYGILLKKEVDVEAD